MKAKTTLPNRAGLPAVFSYIRARAAGISAERLYACRDRGILQKIGRGLYQWTDALAGDPDLLEIVYRSPQAILYLYLGTALARRDDGGSQRYLELQ